MSTRRPTALTIVTLALLVLLPALAVLQYRWVGQVSEAERERRQRNLQIAALQFRDALDGEIARAALTLRPDAATVRERAWYRFADRYESWAVTASEPRIVSALYLVDDGGGRLRLQRWDATSQQFDASEWPAALQALHDELERERVALEARQPGERRFAFAPGSGTFVMLPLPNFGPRQQGGNPRREPMFAFTILQLDLEFIRTEWLPTLVARHFTNTGGDSYRVAILSAGDPSDVIYRSDPDAPTDPRNADAIESIHGAFAGGQLALFRRREGERRDDGERREIRREETRRGDDDRRSDVFVQVFEGTGPEPRDGVLGRFGNRTEGRWTLLVQHESGSLEAAVSAARRRNLGISFGILMLLSVNIALLALASRRAERLARQQMEFVAGVSHELRTPVAVIRSAGENLAQGVVASGDRVKRYGETISTEARRLGEMVERVLLYAGIESGLWMTARTPVSPAALIAGAVDAASSAVPGVRIECRVAADLPDVLGDETALRSAVQNLLINAAKYGDDGWVGVDASAIATGRRREVQVDVRDRGRGIAPEDLPHVFEPFYRGHTALSQRIQGSGLGLSLVKRIVEAHGGRITVATGAGGSTFTIALPATDASAAVVTDSPSVAQPAEGAAHS